MNEIVLPAGMLLQAAEHKQRAAADPNISAWVRANAGTGKTHVLVQRILRLLLAGASPRSILCLTFTKNAAAEMEARVLGKLGEWATATDTLLQEQLSSMLGRPSTVAEESAARCLFASVIDAPGGLAMMTIHSFCERVLRRYSLEAGVPADFSILTEEEANEALREATARAFGLAGDGKLEGAFQTLVAYAGEEEFGRTLQAMLSERSALIHLFKTSGLDPAADATSRLRALLGLQRDDTKDSLLRSSVELLEADVLRDVIHALTSGTSTDQNGARRFEAVQAAANDEMRFSALRTAFLTKDGPRKSLMNSKVRERWSDLHDRLCRAQETFIILDEKLCALKVVEATDALLQLSGAIFDFYEKEKHARTSLDFDDLIDKTLNLLFRPGAAEWVLYQLDSRIDHILLDEAQDTSPRQWAILEKLTSDFFAGEGSHETVPTIFAVGDEKQSIYGFQGSAPELLAWNGRKYSKKVHAGHLNWRDIDLDLSFRTLAPILAAVDGLCRHILSLSDSSPPPHLAYRNKGIGFVEFWEPERGEKRVQENVWDIDAETEASPRPEQALAKRIAEQIKHWFDTGAGLLSLDRAIEPGDILILLRKREPMASLLQRELRQLHVPVAGVDRIGLLDTIAVKDLLALVDALLLPDDDLALAAALKSPLFGFSDDDLFDIAHGRSGSLVQALESAGGSDRKYAVAVAKLRDWRARALANSPSEFFGYLLSANGGREAFTARLGSQCHDALNELLALADNFVSAKGATLSEFVSFLRGSASEVKREMDQEAREVRIMTVHGAKGLESNIVILADTCSNKGAKPSSIFFLDDESGMPAIPGWAVKGSSSLPLLRTAKEARKQADERESARLLYVAMTRARDRLYVAGFHNSSDVPQGCWYDTIRTALASHLGKADDFAGRVVWRFGESEAFVSHKKKDAIEDATILPPWIKASALAETHRNILSPSELVPWIGDAKRQLDESGTSREDARASGTLLHRLLEILPVHDVEYRGGIGELIAAVFPAKLSRQQRRAAVDAALALLSALDALALLSGLSEAGMAFLLKNEYTAEEAVIIGQADRILLGESDVTVLDYKSGASVDDEQTSPSYLGQLAVYRSALQRIYPGKKVRAALINTRSKMLTRLDAPALDAIIANLPVGDSFGGGRDNP